MLERLDAIDWSKVEHAYGPATDVPDMIRALDSSDDRTRHSAFHGAYGNIFHQGTRYAATPHAIPFLIELAAQPKPKQPSELLTLLVHCVAGYFGPVGGPYNATGAIWGTVTKPMADYGETKEILEACEVAAEPAVPLCVRLLSSDQPSVRAAAARVLAALRRFSERYEVVPRLRERLANEKEPSVRAVFTFALTHLVPPKEGALKEIFESDPDDLVRVIAAMGCVRRGEATPAMASALVGWLSDEELSDGYTALPFGADDLAGDIGHLLGELGPDALKSALPSLIGRLSTTSDFGAVGILHAALAATFGEGVDAKGASSPPSRDAAPADANALTPEQRKLLETLAHNQSFWMIGNAMTVLIDHGLPSMRETMAEFLGITVEEDPVEAARMGARMFDAFGPERELQAWLEMLAKFPDDFEALARAGLLLVHLDKHEEALPLLRRAVANGSESDDSYGEAVFVYGSACFGLERLEEAYESFTRAEPLLQGDARDLARQNRIAMLQRLGRAEEALALDAERTPEDAEGFYHRGLAEVKAGKYYECIASIGRAIEIEPDFANSHYTLACAHALLGDADRALASIARALELDPDLAPDIAADSDFVSLQTDARFEKLVRR